MTDSYSVCGHGADETCVICAALRYRNEWPPNPPKSPPPLQASRMTTEERMKAFEAVKEAINSNPVIVSEPVTIEVVGPKAPELLLPEAPPTPYPADILRGVRYDSLPFEVEFMPDDWKPPVVQPRIDFVGPRQLWKEPERFVLDKSKHKEGGLIEMEAYFNLETGITNINAKPIDYGRLPTETLQAYNKADADQAQRMMKFWDDYLPESNEPPLSDEQDFAQNLIDDPNIPEDPVRGLSTDPLVVPAEDVSDVEWDLSQIYPTIENEEMSLEFELPENSVVRWIKLPKPARERIDIRVLNVDAIPGVLPLDPPPTHTDQKTLHLGPWTLGPGRYRIIWK